MPQFPANIDLTSLNGSNGFTIQGGSPIASAGDVNGDGRPDLIAGPYVFFGPSNGFPASVDPSTLNGSNGFKLIAPSDNTITTVSSADVNGDGFADLIIGATVANSDPYNNRTLGGVGYVVFGKGSAFSASIDLTTLNGTNGFKLNQDLGNTYSRWSAVPAGDVNGDGFADVITGGPPSNYNAFGGTAHVVYGKASGFAASVDLGALSAADGFTVFSTEAYYPYKGPGFGDTAGYSVASAGDINGDGFDDFLVGAPTTYVISSYSGAAYLVYGKATGFPTALDLNTMSPTDGFRLDAIGPDDAAGRSVSSAGDVNGDGLADIIVTGGIGGYSATQASFVVFGSTAPFPEHFGLANLNGSNGFSVTETGPINGGISVASAGDVNGDGLDDVIVSDGSGNYVVFGKASGLPANINVSALDGSNGFRLTGYAGPVAGAGDLNGDGLADVAIGNNTPSGSVVYGVLPNTAVSRTGTGASQNLVGGDLADTLSGLNGDDVLYGHGGNDTLDGGAGTDTAVYYGSAASYAISTNGSGVTTVQDLRGGSPDGPTRSPTLSS